MGYKNPMAMALLGQLFILAGFTAASTSKLNWKRTGPLAALLILEVVYLVTLQSRAALFGLAAGLIFLFCSLIRRRQTETPASHRVVGASRFLRDGDPCRNGGSAG